MNSKLREAMKYTLTARGRCAETGEYHVAYDIDETIDGLMVIIDRYATEREQEARISQTNNLNTKIFHTFANPDGQYIKDLLMSELATLKGDTKPAIQKDEVVNE